MTHTTTRDLIVAAMQAMGDGPFASRSTMWAGYIDGRQNFPTDEQFATFLASGSSFVTGVGSTGPKGDEEYRQHHAATVERFTQLLSLEELAAYPEPAIGAPHVLECSGRRGSALYLKNFASATYLEQLIAAYAARKRKLKVLEIGAGYGGVAQVLLAKGIAASYTIVDLPENLCLSSMFLTACFPDMSYRVGNSTDATTFEDEVDLRFVLPNDIVHLQQTYDLVINQASLGEMPASTAQAYVAWVSQHVGDLFISQNGRARSALPEVVQRYRDYGYDAFAVRGLHTLPTVAGLYHDAHLIAVLGPGEHRDPVFWQRVEVLGVLNSLGCSAEADDLLQALLRGKEEAGIDELGRIVEARDSAAAKTLADSATSKALRLAGLYLTAALRVIDGSATSEDWRRYLAEGKSARALWLAEVGTGSAAAPQRADLPSYFAEQAAAATPELLRWFHAKHMLRTI